MNSGADVTHIKKSVRRRLIKNENAGIRCIMGATFCNFAFYFLLTAGLDAARSETTVAGLELVLALPTAGEKVCMPVLTKMCQPRSSRVRRSWRSSVQDFVAERRVWCGLRCHSWQYYRYSMSKNVPATVAVRAKSKGTIVLWLNS